MTLRECVENKFELVDLEDAEQIINWIAKAWEITSDTELDKNKIDCICDRHWESSEEDMFDWIHDGDESPSEIYMANWVTELDNVLVLNDGSCYFWYEINN